MNASLKTRTSRVPRDSAGMHVLDLDLDFFLNDVAYLQPEDADALSSLDYQPWPAAKVRRFLEENLGCSTRFPIPGRTVMYHESALDFWHELVAAGKLTVPFEIIHVDAHSDLGMGNPQSAYIMTRLLHLEPDQRSGRLERSRVDSGNYLAFAVACRWVSAITWVRHHHSQNDLPVQYFRQLGKHQGLLKLRSVDEHAFESPLQAVTFDYPSVRTWEPAVPFQMWSWGAFQTRKPFDYVVLSNSPNFTPRESDHLLPVIEEYISRM